MTVDIVHPCAVAPSDLEAWRRLQDATPAFGSPLLGPEFAQVVGAVRKDARVAMWRDPNGEPLAFLAYHRRPHGFGRPIGAPFCDYHAVISGDDVELDAAAILSGAKLKALRLSGLVDPFGVFGGRELASEPAYRIVLGDHPPAASAGDAPSDPGLAHLNVLKASSANRFKNFRRYSKRLEQTFGPLRMVAEDLDPSAFEHLLAWKRRQLDRTGLHDFLRPAWVDALMRRLFETPSAARNLIDAKIAAGAKLSDRRFGGLMISLYAGDRHVAGHFGVRLGGWYHPWIGATAPNLEAHGAGFVHQWKAVEAMGRLGLQTYDLGPGSDHWKRLFTADIVEVAAGLITAPTLRGRLARAGDRLWTTPPLDEVGLAQRLRNRLDQIATIETAWTGRAQGLLAMASALDRRAASRRAQTGSSALDAAPAPASLLKRLAS
jgi:CelD/BcsL family acetyltransferase involved in cellulose biosynthesis